MTNIIRRLAAGLLSGCVMTAALPAFSCAASAETETGINVSLDASEALAAAVAGVESGQCNLFIGPNREPAEQPLNVGSVMDKTQTYYAFTNSGKYTFGKQCYIYAQGVYGRLFDELPLHGFFNNGDSMGCAGVRSRQAMGTVTALDAQTLAEHKVMPGAYLRTTANADGTYSSSNGHSMLILGYTDTEIRVLEGNSDGYGLIRDWVLSYETFNRIYLEKHARVIGEIVQPTDSVYESEFGLRYDLFAAAPADQDLPDDPDETAGPPLLGSAPETATVTEPVIPEQPAEWNGPAVTLYRLGAGVQLPLPEGVVITEWTSNDDFAVAVDADGVVTGLRNGTSDVIGHADGCLYRFRVTVRAVNWDDVGDATCDGSVDSDDAIAVLREFVQSILSGSSTLPENGRARADADADGDVTSDDAILILRYFTNTLMLTADELDPQALWTSLLSADES